MSKGLGMLLLAMAAAVALVAGLRSGSSKGATEPVAVYPSQGTPVASPNTQVSFRGASAAELGQVTVQGSRTGNHTGRLAEHSDGDGASFLPAKPFAPGERVTVRAGLSLVNASGGAVSFTILTPPRRHGEPQLLRDPGGHARVPHFHTRPGFEPPTLQVLKKTADAAPGSIFVGAKAGLGQDGPAIYDENGGLVWFKRMPRHQSSFDFRVQQYEGKPVLTWWQGRAIFPGEGLGVGMIYDSTYRPLKIVRAGNGYVADLHEFTLTPQGTALLMAYRPVMWNLRPAGGSGRAVALDNVLQEIDVKTGLVEREWHSLGNVSVAKAAVKPIRNVPFDAFHANSIEEESDGNWLVSSRNTNGLYEVDRTTGRVLWQIGGKGSSFRMGPGAQSLGQHDARRAPNGNITLFDNGTFGIKVGRPSRALELAVDQGRKTATVVHAFQRTNPRTRTFSQGSVRTLPNGNLIVGWGGANAYLTEFTPSGAVAFDAIMHPSGDDTYRAFRFPWSGAFPAEPPRVATSVSGSSTTAWASWNGATEVARWRVLAGSDANSLSQVAETASTGFETEIQVPGTPAFVKVQPLDSTGKVIANSAVTPTSKAVTASRR